MPAIPESKQDHPDPVRRWSHDVRNAANCLRLCTSAFEICQERSEQLELIEQIEQSADKLTNLIDNVPAELAIELS